MSHPIAAAQPRTAPAWCAVVGALVATAGLGCNALWDIDALRYESHGGATAQAGHGGQGANAGGGASGVGAGGSAGGAGAFVGGAAGSGASAAGSGGAGGSGGTLVERTLVAGERPGADLAGVTADTQVAAEAPTVNYGAGDTFGPDANPRRVALLRFDLSSLPPGTTVLDAALEVAVAICFNCEASDGTVAAYEVSEPWEEGSCDGTAGVANYTERLVGTLWSTAGVGAGSRADQPFASFYPNVQGQVFAISVPRELAQRWIDMPSTNYGISFEVLPTPPATSTNDGVAFRPRESAEAATRPALVLHLLVPE